MRPTRQAVLFVADGLRPDAIPLVPTPEIDALVARGAWSWKAQTVWRSVTLPAHVSLFCSAPPERTGVLHNDWRPADPPLPSLIDVVHGAGLGTAALYTWEELRDLSRPGALDVSYYRREDHEADHMLEVAAQAAAYIAQEKPALAFVYLEAPDTLGHDWGWMSERYLQSVTKVDQAIGLVMDALRAAGGLDDILVLLTSDHGGHETKHGSTLPEDLLIPWIVAGPGVRRGHRIAGPVNIIDTAPTLAHLMGLAAPPEWQGRVIDEALAMAAS